MGKLRGILLLLVLLPVLAVPVAAEGSITVAFQSNEGRVNGGSVTLHYVGTKIPEGYRIMDAFGGGIVLQKDATSPHLAQWLAQSQMELGWTEYLDPEGRACFSPVAPGLYLAVQPQSDPDYFPVLPFMVEVTGEEEVHKEIAVLPILLESPRTGQHPAPILGAIGMVVSGVGLAACVGRKRRK